jgi:hypothetical protein
VWVRARGQYLLNFNARLADVAQPLFRIFFQALPQQMADGRGRGIGQRGPRRRGPQRGSDRVGHRLARKRSASRQHLVQHASERPDVGALVDRLAARLLRAHVGEGAENDALTRAADRHRRRLRQILTRRRIARRRLRQAEVEHLHDAGWRDLILAGLRSRWTMPFSCAASSASAIWRAMSSASFRGRP